MMGSKTRARQTHGRGRRAVCSRLPSAVSTSTKPQTVAEQIGYPVMLKAAAGGGGKGMRLVHDADELHSASKRARAKRSAPSATTKSISRSHRQPAPHRDSDLRRRARQRRLPRRARVFHSAPPSEGSGRSALADRRSRTCGAAWAKSRCSVAKAASYTNAGTVEFLVDQQRELLLPRDEHAPAGRASGHRTRHRPRSRSPADSQSRPARSCRSSRKTSRFAGTRSNAASTPRIPTTTSSLAPARSRCLIAPSGPGIRRDSGMYEGWTVPLDTIRCLRSSIGYGDDREQAIIAPAARAVRVFRRRHQDEHLALPAHPERS